MNRLFKMAIRLGVTNAVQLYVANGVDLNATDDGGMSPLMFAADAGQVQICRILLEAGADPLQCNNEGKDAHFFALKNGSSEVVSVLRGFLGNRAEELQKRREDFQPGAVDSDFDYADRARTYHNKKFVCPRLQNDHSLIVAEVRAGKTVVVLVSGIASEFAITQKLVAEFSFSHLVSFTTNYTAGRQN